jgi:N4-gp56 family major capsid protein
MADTRAATGLTVQDWDDQFFVEYIQESQFAILYGEGENSIIQVKENLTKKKGDTVTYALINRLTNAATTGTNTLEGNEEDMSQRSYALTVDKRRHAVRIAEMEEQRGALSIRGAAKPALKTWADENTRDAIIAAMHSKGGVAYASATEAQKDTWLSNNSDRVLFGAAKVNHVSLDHSTSLATVDGTTDILNKDAIELLKRIALTASPKIRPYKDEGNNKRYFVAYAHPYCFRDLRASLVGTLDDTTAAGQAIRLFEGGDLLWDGVIIKELDDMPVLTNVGSGGTTDVAPVFFLGAQAIGYAVAKRWKSMTKEFDYGDKVGAAIEAIDAFGKITFGSGADDTTTPKDAGLVTGYFACVADT